MGLFDLLFKSRAARAEEKRVESGVHGAGSVPDSTSFLVPRERPSILPTAPRNATPEPSRSGIRPSVASRQIVVTLGDVIGRIPPEFLRQGDADLRRELRFGTDEFLADIPRGRVTVALSNIAAQCPEVFRVPITDDDDREVRLPLQKLLDQLVGQEPARARDEAKEERGFPVAAVEQVPASAAPAVPPSTVEQQDPEAGEHQAPARIDAPLPGAGGRTIQLSLAAILAGCPQDIFLGEKPRVDDSVRVTLPFEPIERQLTNAVVEISAHRFVALLPPAFMGSIHVREGVKIPLPLEEIFQNLPGSTMPERPRLPEREPTTVEIPVASPAPELPVAQAAEPAPAPPAPEPRTSEVVASPAFQFFAPTPPHPRAVPPPPLSVRPIGADQPREAVASEAINRDIPLPAVAPTVEMPPSPQGPAEPAPPIERPAPTLHSLEIHASAEPTVSVDSLPARLQAATPQLSPEAVADSPTVPLSRPPVARPLVILPPPIAVGAAATPVDPAHATPAESPLETTSDQTAVLEFLSGGMDSEQGK